MLKLYKKIGNVIRYWESWTDAKEITIHGGSAGNRGESRTLEFSRGGNPNSLIEQEARMLGNDGYRKIPQAKLQRIVVQYRIAGMGTTQDLDKRTVVEDLLNECLGWTGLGHCDGGDIGSGTMNLFCFVVVGRIAANVIVEDLRENKVLDGAVVALSSPAGSEVLWPKDLQGTFTI